MAVTVQYRLKYTCDLESERDLAWGDGAIIYTKENGGRFWKIVGGTFQQNTSENPEAIDWGKVQNKPTAYVPGYISGSGGTITQLASKSTGVILSKFSGAITLVNSSLAAATIVSFTLTNTVIAATDVLVLNHISGGTPGSYILNARCAAGSAIINIRNNTAGSLSEAIVIQFAVIKGVNN